VVDVSVPPVADIAATAMETAVEVASQETAALVEGLAPVDPVVGETDPEANAASVLSVAAIDQMTAAADDLTRLVGVGPKLAASLVDMGVTSFAQIAAWNADDLARFDTALSLKGRAVRDAWVDQARRFAEG
jgi:predicted flap endonuclease-1-like 5' DNA nuclease